MLRTLESNREPGLLRIIIPAKNEATRIRATLITYCEYFKNDATLFVVANGCTDDTVRVVNDLRSEYDNLRILVVDAGIGKGGAIRAGLTVGDERYIAFADADGSTSPRQIERLLEHCRREGIDGAIGSRWLPGSTIARRQPLRRRVASRAFNAVVRVMFGLPYLDTQCGAKVFSRAAIDHVLEKLEIANFAFDVDLLLALKKLDCVVEEVPIAWSDVPEYSQVKLLRSGSSMFWALMRLWVRHSPLRGLPFLDMLARSSVIPVRSGLKVLILHTKAASEIDSIVAEFGRQGHQTMLIDLSRPASLGPFLWWYMTYAHRTYDIIVDCAHGWISKLISLSAKPKITAKSITSMHESNLPGLVEQTARRCGYSAFLWRAPTGEWVLSSSFVPAPLLELV